ncbi:MAG: RodZ domain-containing protein [Dokdonella sp.]
MDERKSDPLRSAEQGEAVHKSGVHVHDARASGQISEDSGSQLALPLSWENRARRADQASMESGAKEMSEHEPADARPAAPIELQDQSPAPFGQRLAAAREQCGLSRADVAARLKLPTRLVARLESDDYAGLTDGMFLRGYLASYARLVGVPVEQAARVAAAHTQTTPLVATGTISHSRYLLERYSVSATYLVLTAIIVVPAVWLATHGGLEQNLARTTPLDPPTSISTPAQDASISAAGAGDASSNFTGIAASGTSDAASSHADERAPEQKLVVASMTPFANVSTPPATSESDVAAANRTLSASGAHQLDLTLSEASWVEITAADGRKLEYGILGAGSTHTYHSNGPISVRLGNAQGARMRGDGADVDLASYQRANVAHLRLFGPNGASRLE